MVTTQLIARGIQAPQVLKAMGSIPREAFVPDKLKALAYEDGACPIGYRQTISQPFMVAFMTEAAQVRPTAKVLEIGTGCGYQTAILASLCKEVYTIELIEPLGRAAAKRLNEMGYKNIYYRIGDGYSGWPSKAPFDSIIVTAAPPVVPTVLIGQLGEGGNLVIPVGKATQELMRITCTKGAIKQEKLMAVKFVPMVSPFAKD